MLNNLPPWELLLKRILWTQLGDIQGKKILDFGSGIGVTANHYAKWNKVVAVEPDEESLNLRWTENPYRHLHGSTDILRKLESESFDLIFCHNVLEYVSDREEILREFYRLLKPSGFASIVKHNRAGRVMQMVVLLNEFDRAKNLLDGKDDVASKYGTIRYYENADITKWCDGFTIAKTFGIRTFWDMQQNQELHKDTAWQKKMIEMELRVSEVEEFRNVAFFHHLILTK